MYGCPAVVGGENLKIPSLADPRVLVSATKTFPDGSTTMPWGQLKPVATVWTIGGGGYEQTIAILETLDLAFPDPLLIAQLPPVGWVTMVTL